MDMTRKRTGAEVPVLESSEDRRNRPFDNGSSSSPDGDQASLHLGGWAPQPHCAAHPLDEAPSSLWTLSNLERIVAGGCMKLIKLTSVIIASITNSTAACE